MASSPNLHPIIFTRIPETSKGHDDISQLFQNAEEDKSLEAGNKRSVNWPSWLGDPELIVYKLFYLFFYAATALFAYLPLYYNKSLLLDHHHVGILMGIRPFCGFFGAPILGSFADKFNKYKSILYTGLLTYIVVYLSITFVNGVPKDCGVHMRINYTNSTQMSQAIRNIITSVPNDETKERSLKVLYSQGQFARQLASSINRRNDYILHNEQSRVSSHSEQTAEGKLFEKPAYLSEDTKRLPRGGVIFKDKFESDQVDNLNGEPKPGDMESILDNVDNLTKVNCFKQRDIDTCNNCLLYQIDGKFVEIY